MKRGAFVIAALAAGAAMIAGAALGQGLNIAIATGGTGGVYYPLGGGLGNILGKELSGVTATAQVTGGSVDLGADGAQASVQVPDQVLLEREYETKRDRVELEIELKWSTAEHTALETKDGADQADEDQVVTACVHGRPA